MSTELMTASQEIQGTLAKMKDEFALVIPKFLNMSPEAFIKMAQMAVNAVPGLASCDRSSVYAAFRTCAQDGLIPDGREAVVLPFKGKGKYMPMVAGICKRVRNSGEISVIDSLVVYENDKYESWVDEKGPHFKHIRAMRDRGNPVLTYAYAIAKDGGCFFEEIDEEQMAAIQAKSQANDSPWKGPFKDEMRRKSAIHRLGKHRLPSSGDMDPLLKQDAEFYEDNEKIEPEGAPATSSRLGTIIETKATSSEEHSEKPIPTAKEAVQMAAAVFPKSKPVSEPQPRPTSSQKQSAQKQLAVVISVGKISNIKVQSSPPESEKHWIRFAVQINNNEKWYGTFDSKVGEELIVPAADSKAEVRIGYTERQANGKIFRDIVSFERTSQEGDEGEIPI